MIVKTDADLEEQRCFAEVQDQADAFAGNIDPSLLMRNVDSYGFHRTNDTSHGNEIFQTTSEHFIQRSCHQRGSKEKGHESYRAIYRSYEPC